MQIDLFGSANVDPSDGSRLLILPTNVLAFCDGAAKGNPGDGGWGVCLQDESGRVLVERFGGAANVTNNQMELTAVIEALKLVSAGSTVHVVTDSAYVVDGLTKWLSGWKRRRWVSSTGAPVKNQDLWKALDTLWSTRRAKATWVRGHNGHPGNERADALANLGVAELRERRGSLTT